MACLYLFTSLSVCLFLLIIEFIFVELFVFLACLYLFASLYGCFYWLNFPFINFWIVCLSDLSVFVCLSVCYLLRANFLKSSSFYICGYYVCLLVYLLNCLSVCLVCLSYIIISVFVCMIEQLHSMSVFPKTIDLSVCFILLPLCIYGNVWLSVFVFVLLFVYLSVCLYF